MAGVGVGGLARRGLAHYLLGVALGVQLAFLLDVAGVLPLAPAALTWALAAAFPLGATGVQLALDRGGGLRADARPVPWRETLLAGGAWALWAGSYFVVGLVVDGSRAILLPDVLERRFPLWPSFSLLYVAVYPLSLLPAFRLADRDRLRRYARGWIAIVALSDIVFCLLPVAMRRPDLSGLAPSFGRYALGVIHAADPPTNCLPSTHCAMAVYAALALARESRRLGAWAIGTALTVAASTVLVRQHYVVDVLAGVALALVARRVFVGAAARPLGAVAAPGSGPR